MQRILAGLTYQFLTPLLRKTKIGMYAIKTLYFYFLSQLEKVLTKIDDYPAFDQVTQTNFSLTISIPRRPTSHAILRFRYQVMVFFF